jgi:hypothetical protein
VLGGAPADWSLRFEGGQERFEGGQERFEGRQERFEGGQERFEGGQERFERRRERAAGRAGTRVRQETEWPPATAGHGGRATGRG